MELHSLPFSTRSTGSFLRNPLVLRWSKSQRHPLLLVPLLQSGASIGGAGNSKPLWEAGRGAGMGASAMRVLKSSRKENIWSVDNEAAAKAVPSDKRRIRNRRKKRGRRANDTGRKSMAGVVLVSDSMLVDIDTVLQTQEPVIIPSWETFTSSLSGIWKGVGAVFSPLTAEMEPIGIGKKTENLYDCYTLSQIEKTSLEGQIPAIHRKTNWLPFNPFGEMPSSNQSRGSNQQRDGLLLHKDKIDLGKSEVLDEDLLSLEPGLVFFEDGSYSRGPFEIPVGYFDESKYFLSPTFKFEQCLVKGCHKRLRIVHTIEFAEGGASIQITRVAVYEEQWDQPFNIADTSSVEFDLKPFSQRRRTQPTELSGSWKVFEVSATPVSPEADGQDASSSYVYLCMETLKRRSLPENQSSFREEETHDMQGVTVLWLPGGVTAYVDVNDDGVLCIGVGWYSDEGINLVMERDYGTDGRLKEVRWKSEVKRRWNDIPQADES